MEFTDLQQPYTGSDEAFELLFASNPMPMWVFDTESRLFLEVNRAAIETYGYTRDEFVSMCIEDIHPPEEVAALRNLVATSGPALRSSGEWRHLHKDGSIHYVLASSHAIRFRNRSARLAMMQDITDRKAAQRALEESEQRYRSLFENTDDAIAMLDLQGRYQRVNPAGLRLTGYTESEFIGSSIDLIVDPAHLEAARALFRDVAAGPQEVDMVLARKDGSRVDVHVTLGPILVGHDVVGVFTSARDTTERNRAEAENRALIAQVHRERERLENLLSSVPGVVWEFWDEPDPTLGRVNYVSRHIETMLGYTPEDWLGRANFWLTVVHPDDRARAQERAREIYESGGGADVYRSITRDGRILWLESHSVSICDETGKRLGMRGVNMDVTERVLAEEAVRDSEERYRLVQLATQEVIWDWDLRTGELVHNDSLLTVFGYSPDQVGRDGQWWYDRTHPDDREEMVRTLWDVIRGGGAYWTGEYRFMRGDGTWADVLDRSYVTRSADGAAVRMIGSMTDMTAHKRAGETLRFLARASETLAESLDYETTLANLAHTIVPGLADYCYIDVFEAEDRVRRLAVAHADPEQEDLLRQLQLTYFTSSAPRHPRLKALRRGETQLVTHLRDADFRAAAEDEDHLAALRKLGACSFMGVPLSVHGEAFGGISFMYADSGRRYTQQDLALAIELARRASVAVENARLYREIRKADLAKDQFLAMLSHELRNPLGAISNALKLIDLRGKADPSTQRTLNVVDRQAKHMARLVDDLLDVSRITQGKIELRTALITLSDIVDQALQTAAPLLEAREHTLSTHVDPEPVWLQADPIRLAQVLTNLLSNAAKYTKPGGSIVLTAGREDNQAVLRVRDSGMGIAPDMLRQVFDLFAQAERSLDRAEGGLGIGLTVVKSLVEMHHGAVEAHSEGPGKGSEFVVRLPALSAASAPRADGDPAANSGDAAPKRLRIMLVEDNVDAAKTLGEILGMWGYTVRIVHDGLTALEVAARFRADVVLLDIGLPSMDGYEVARRLRGNADLHPATLVALTGYGQEEDHIRSREAGFNHHLVKPVDFATLESLLSGLEPS
ncbi:MAG TPA: PAS domain S-box protein [Armatimonadota bacterium]|jgi:PAS domain S-box-containing protein